MEENFDPDLIHAIFKLVWRKKAFEREKLEGIDNFEHEGAVGTVKKIRPTSANATAVKLSCELLRIFITVGKYYLNYNFNPEAIQRAAAIAEVEGHNQIEGTHLERILPQLLLDF